MQVPFAGLGTIPAGQHWPHDVTMLGSQHVPSGVITSLELEHGVTHLPPKLIFPCGQGIPVNGIGQMEPSGLVVVFVGGTAGRPVLSQMQTSAIGPDAAAACVVCPGPRFGHSHTYMT